MAPAPATPTRSRHLARAGWSIVSTKNLLAPEALPLDLNDEGARLVAEVARCWTSRYHFYIEPLGPYEGAFHYQCLFSCPTTELPVPSTILSTRFALVVPGAAEGGSAVRPRLLYSFEEGDLRHEWALEQDAMGRWHAAQGQQFGSLADGVFEQFLDRVIREKDTVRERGIDLTTPFEETRLGGLQAVGSEIASDLGSSLSDEDTRSSSKNTELSPPIVTVNQRPLEGSVLSGQLPTIDQQEMADAMRAALKASGLLCEMVTPPSSLAELLANIFDAADEENIGELPHYEVARLLSATLPGFGLELWDIHLLLTSAQENDDGFIECKPFIQAAPEIIQALRKRRMSFRERGLPGVEIPLEAVKHCFSDEVTSIAGRLAVVFDQCAMEDSSRGKWHQLQPQAMHRSRTRNSLGSIAAQGSLSIAVSPEVVSLNGSAPLGDDQERHLVGIKRRFCLECTSQLPERISPQEAQRLLQMLPEDEDGYIRIDDLAEHLEALRTEAMLNALVETDVLSLRTHLVLLFRRIGMSEDGKMKLWMIKHALLQADQICLTRLQIHVLLCLADSDTQGFVDIAGFLGMCCVVIPHMFDARKFVATAERLISEHAEAMRRSENAELAALGASRVGQLGQDGEESQESKEVDQETVERTLVQVMNLHDDTHRNPPCLPPEQLFSILHSNEKEVQSCQLSDFELCGLAAEMMPDADGFVAYGDHIRKWVPIIFEQRKNRLLAAYLQDGAAEVMGIEEPDLEGLEKLFPLLPPESKVHREERRNSHSRTSGERRGSRSDYSRQHSKQDPGSFRRPSCARLDPDDPNSSPPMRSRSSILGAEPRRSSKNRRTFSSIDGHSKINEPPPGRGFARRKARMATMGTQPPA